MPKVSVIIPVYNTEKYLRQCLDSVLNQTLTDIEIICVDDGSTDNSLNILKEYAEKDNRIKIIEQQNQFAGVARNTGANIATGEYLHFMDADDLIVYNAYEKIYEELSSQEYPDIIRFSAKAFDNSSGEDIFNEFYENTNIDSQYLNSYLNINEHSEIMFKLCVTPWIGFVKRTFYMNNNLEFNNFRVCNDRSFFINSILYSKKLYLYDFCAILHRVNNRDSLRGIRGKNFDCNYKSVALIDKICKQHQLDSNKYKIIMLNELADLFGFYDYHFAQGEISYKHFSGFVDFVKKIDTTNIENELVNMPYYKTLLKIRKLKIKSWAYYKPTLKKYIQCLFSINNSEDKTHKIITILGINIKYKRKTDYEKSSKRFAKIIHKNIKKYKYVHIMKNDKFNKPFVDFLNKNFNSDEHMVLCYRDLNYYDLIQKFPEGENVYEYKNIFDLKLNQKNVKKVIFHSLFMPDAVKYLYENKELLKNKAFWAIWGGDLYNAPRDEKNDYVRSNFKGYWSVADEKVVVQKYKTNENFKRISYIFPISKNIIENVIKDKVDYIKIQINNSCDDSTLEMLDILSKFKNENIKITTILSYGKIEFKDEIIKKGLEIFGDKFEYIENYMAPNEYAQHLAQNDILVLNQNRQQGVGNTLVSLYFGNKVFIRSDVPTYQFFNEQDISVFDTKKIKDIDFCHFIENLYNAKNTINVEKYFDDKYLTKLWKDAMNE